MLAELEGAEIRPPRVTITKARVDVGQESVFEALQMSAARSVISLAGRYPLPNLVEIMANLMDTPRRQCDSRVAPYWKSSGVPPTNKLC